MLPVSISGARMASKCRETVQKSPYVARTSVRAHGLKPVPRTPALGAATGRAGKGMDQ